MKNRIIEDDNGIFYPQSKEGWFRGWKMYDQDALIRMEYSMRSMLIEQSDPLRFAKFRTKQEAEDFISDVKKKADDFWDAFYREKYDKHSREITWAVKSKSVHNALSRTRT